MREVVLHGCWKPFTLQSARLMSDTAVNDVELCTVPVQSAASIYCLFVSFFEKNCFVFILLRRVPPFALFCTLKGVIQMNTRSVQI